MRHNKVYLITHRNIMTLHEYYSDNPRSSLMALRDNDSSVLLKYLYTH